MVLSELGVRKLFIIGPHRPCESNVKGSRIMLLMMRSPMLSSPRIDSDGSTLLCLFLRRNFFRLSSHKCESAWADIVVTSSGEFDRRNGLLLLPIVMCDVSAYCCIWALGSCCFQ